MPLGEPSLGAERDHSLFYWHGIIRKGHNSSYFTVFEYQVDDANPALLITLRHLPRSDTHVLIWVAKYSSHVEIGSWTGHKLGGLAKAELEVIKSGARVRYKSFSSWDLLILLAMLQYINYNLDYTRTVPAPQYRRRLTYLGGTYHTF